MRTSVPSGNKKGELPWKESSIEKPCLIAAAIVSGLIVEPAIPPVAAQLICDWR